MRPNWPTKKLGEVTKKEKFAIVDGPFGTQLHTSDYTDKGVPLIRILNIAVNKFLSEDLKYISKEKYRELKRSRVTPGDILISKTGTIGRACILPPDIPEALITASCAKISVDNSIAIPFYVCAVLNTKFVYSQLIAISTGTSRLGFNLQKLRRVKLPLPPVDIQEKIVERLDAIRKAQELNDKQIALGEELFQSLSYKELNSKIKDWKSVNFGEKEIVEIVDGDRGENYPKKNEFKKSGYCIFLNTKNVTANGFVFNDIDFISKERDEKLRKGKLQRNDVVVTTRGTVGNSALYGESVEFKDMRINSGMVIVRPNTKKIVPEFLLNLIQNNLVQDKFKQILSGSAQPQLPICNLVKVKFPLPPLGIQRQVVQKLQAVQDYKKTLLQQKQKLQELFESCLDKAMKGELVN